MADSKIDVIGIQTGKALKKSETTVSDGAAREFTVATINQGKANEILKSAKTNEGDSLARDFTAIAIAGGKAGDGLKHVEAGEKQADFAAQLAGEKDKIALTAEDQNLMDSIGQGTSLKKAETKISNTAMARDLTAIAIKGGVSLKKAETVFKQADLLAQLEGFKYVADLSAEEKTLFQELIDGVHLKKVAPKESDTQGLISDAMTRDTTMSELKKGSHKRSLKATETVTKQASLKDQIEGFKQEVALTAEEKTLFDSILKKAELKKVETKQSGVNDARNLTQIAIKGDKARKSLKKITTVVKYASLKLQLESFKMSADLLSEDKALMDDIIKGISLKKAETKAADNIEARDQTVGVLAAGKTPELKHVETVEKQADFKAQLEGFKEKAKLSSDDKTLMESIIYGIKLKKGKTNQHDARSQVASLQARDTAMKSIKGSKARKSLKATTTVVREASLKEQLDGFKESADLTTEEKSLFNQIVMKTALKRARTRTAQVANARDRMTIALRGDKMKKSLKATTTVVKEADLKTQLEGFKATASLTDTDKDLMSQIIAGMQLKKAEVSETENIDTRDKTLGALAGGKLPELKHVETVEKQAAFAAQLEGFKEKAQLSSDDRTMMEEIIHGIRLKAVTTKESDPTLLAKNMSARDNAMKSIKGGSHRKSLKKTETVVKEADFQSQLDGFKATAELSAEEKSLMGDIAAGTSLKSTGGAKEGGVSQARDLTAIALKGGNVKASLKKVGMPVERQADLKAQLEGLKMKMALSSEDNVLMNAIIDGIGRSNLKKAATKPLNSSARDATSLALKNAKASVKLRATETVEKGADFKEQLAGEKMKIELTDEDKNMMKAISAGITLKKAETKQSGESSARDLTAIALKGGAHKKSLKKAPTTLFKMADLKTQIAGEKEKVDLLDSDKQVLSEIAKGRQLKKVTTKESAISTRDLINAAIAGGKGASKLKNAMTVVKQVDFKIQIAGEKEEMQFEMTLLENEGDDDDDDDDEEDSPYKLDVEALVESCGEGNLYGVVECISACNGYINPLHLNSTVEGYTPLRAAAVSGELQIIDFLIKIPGIDPNIQNADGDTALHAACENEHEDVMKALLTMDGIDVDLKNKKGDTAESYIPKKKKNFKKMFADARKRKPKANKNKPRRSLVMVTTKKGAAVAPTGGASLAIPE